MNELAFSTTPAPKLDLGTALLIANQSGNLDGLPLEGLDFSGNTLQRVSFKRSKATKLNLSFADVTKANFDFANLTEANLQNVNALGATFEGASLDLCKAQNANFTNCRFSDMEIKSAHFENAVFVGCRFENVKFVNSYFNDANFQKSTFINVFVDGSKFLKADFSGVDMSGISWRLFQGNPFSTSITEKARGLNRADFARAAQTRQSISKEFLFQEKYGERAPAGWQLSGSLEAYRTELNVSHKEIFEKLGMPERTYFHKKQNNGFAISEARKIFAALKEFDKFA